jgi:ATP-dependent DNA helicase RecG
MAQLSIRFPKHFALLSPDEIYEGLDQVLLSNMTEDKRLERKPVGIHAKEIGTYFSMWANTVPDGGIIVVGMENDGRFSGCNRVGPDYINAIDKAGPEFCPDARFIAKRVDVQALDGSSSFVMVFRIFYREDKVVRTVSHEAFVRRGDQKHKLSEEEIRELEIDRRQLDLEKEPVPQLRFPEDFDSELVRTFVQGVARLHQATQQYQDIEVFQQRRLGAIKHGVFVPNTACALVFARDPEQFFPGCKIKFLRYEGEREKSGAHYNVTKTIPIEGPIPKLIAQASTVLKSQLREFSRMGEDQLWYSAPEYPPNAWSEALVNACVHRSYGLKNMNVFVKMFDDKLVIESPGGFPPLVTPENIYNVHHPRNPTLMHALWYLDIVKEHAEGTKRMRDDMAGMKLPPPEFRQVESGSGYAQVIVTLRNHIEQRKVWVDADASKVLGNAIAKNLTGDEKRIVNFIAENGTINVTQCHRLIATTKKWHAAKRVLQKMVDRGLLRHVHSETVKRDSKAYYTLPEALMPHNGRKAKGA